MRKAFSLNEIISLIKKKDYKDFEFYDGCAHINCLETEMFILEAPDNEVPIEKLEYIADVVNDLDNCIRKALGWLEHFSLKKDKWYPDALDKGFKVCCIYFGNYTYGHDPEPVTNGFALSFRTVEYFPCLFTVKFCRSDKHPFAVEEWLA